MIWHLIRYLSTFTFPAFYKRIYGKNVQNTQVKGPVIIAMNHPNSFTDAIIFTYINYPTRVRYLARGDAFKPGLASWILEQIGIVPIYRIQDGGTEGLKKNDETYKRVNQLLKRNKKIIIFAEGLCVQERRLRPLKKGVARMVFGAYEYLNNDDLVVVPVGVNYSQPDKFRSTVFYNVGEPIKVKDFIADFHNNSAKGNKHFIQALEPKMKELITHINNKDYDIVVLQIESLYKKDLLKQQGLNYKNLEHDYIVTKQITELVNTAEISNKAVLDEFKGKAAIYFEELKKNKLRDWLIDLDQHKNVKSLNLYLRFFLVLAGFPIYAIGLTGNYLPYKLTEKLTKKILKGNIEFYSSIIIGIGMFVFLINYVLWFLITYAFSPNIGWPILTCLVLVLSGWFSMDYYFFKIKTFGMLRAIKNKARVARFLEKRKELLSLINKL
jgi:glycerol-3-phosphate O-acyltransferase/dihydroxyacetone phosphate acyltransferase